MPAFRPLLAFVLFACLLAVPQARAADLTGKWQGMMQTPNGENLEVTLTLQMVGEKLSGIASSSYGEEKISEGTVKGDDVSFLILAQGGQFRVTYKGKLVGEELKFTVTIGDMGDRQLTVKRVK